MPAVFLVMIAAYALINLWILFWYGRALRGAKYARSIACLALLTLMLCSLSFILLDGASWLRIILARAGNVWLGSFFYVFVLTLVADLFALLRRLLLKTPVRDKNAPRFKAAVSILGIVLILAIGGWISAALPVLREERVTVAAGRPDLRPITIAALSDMHLGRTITVARFERALDLLTPHKPDIVLLLGDIFDDHFLLDEAAMAAVIDRLAPPLGAWAVLGNHEYYVGLDKSLRVFEACGIRVLRDQWAVIDGTFVLIGREDYGSFRFTGEDRKQIADIMADLPEKARDLPLILMDHQPQKLQEAEEAGVALQLSGHTHDAQLWPFNLILPYIYENPLGWSQRGETRYYASAGAGTWGPPMRNTARPEVLFFRVEFAEKPRP